VTAVSLGHPRSVIVEGPAEFWDWLVGLDDAGRGGDSVARERHDVTLALLLDLHDATFPPDRDAETATLTRVRHATRHPVWRLVGQGPSGAEVRFHCAFPVGTGVALITSAAGDLARIGDLFWRVPVGRAESLVLHWLSDRARGGRRAVPGLTRGVESGDEHLAVGLARPGAAHRVLALREQLGAGRRARPVVTTAPPLVRQRRAPAYV
jgi:hypothetical protein